MTVEKSCGAVVFTKENGCIRYVVIESKEGILGFPKGHVEGNESEKETALREVLEETGLNVKIIENFRREDIYSFRRKRDTVIKNVVYFLAEYSNQTLVPQKTELNDIYLMDYEKALKSFQFENSKKILTEAHRYVGQIIEKH